MKKRFAAAILWFYTGWSVGAFVAFAVGLPSDLAPILGILAAVFVAGDPRRIIWTRPAIANGAAMLPSTQTLHTA
jgi:hypothetical protein